MRFSSRHRTYFISNVFFYHFPNKLRVKYDETFYLCYEEAHQDQTHQSDTTLKCVKLKIFLVLFDQIGCVSFEFY